MACSFSLLSLFSSSFSFAFPLSLLKGGLVRLIRVNGEVLVHLSSSSQIPSIPPSIQSLVMVVECGISPLYLLLK